MNTTHELIIGDSRRMNEIPDEKIHLVVTSPPYWQLKDYGGKNQIGYDDTYEKYINNLNLVWNESHRTLQKGGRLCINIGDQFARAIYYGRYKVIPIRTEIIKFCENIGFDYMGAIIWQKITTTNTTGGATIMGSYPYPKNGIIKIDYEFILIFKKNGKSASVSKKIKEKSKMTNEEWNKYFTGHWNFPGEKQDKHLAMFPEELPKRLIKMFTFVGDTVLDPFLGSGTTSLAARNLSRNSIGYEVNEDFVPVIKEKLNVQQSTFINNATYIIKKQSESEINTEKMIKNLPYIFKDPITFDKRIDPKKMNFGSKIDNSNNHRKNYYSVRKIINPEILVLNDNLKVRLLGIKELKTNNNMAVEYLLEKVMGKKVLLKFDEIKHDEANNLLCYLYLQNKTFINAHLIKKGFVDVDTSIKHRYLSKFVRLRW